MLIVLCLVNFIVAICLIDGNWFRCLCVIPKKKYTLLWNFWRGKFYQLL